MKIFLKKKSNELSMNKWFELLLGLVLFISTIYSLGMNLGGMGTAALEFLKGGLIWLVLMIGFLLIILGISDLKE